MEYPSSSSSNRLGVPRSVIFIIEFIFLIVVFPSYLLALECPTDWTSYGTECYTVLDISANWQDAVGHCSDLGATLLEIRSQEESDFVIPFISGVQASPNPWVYCSDFTRTGTWVCGEDDHAITFSHWGSNEPDSSNQEDCAALRLSHSTWHDRDCSEIKGIVCQKAAAIAAPVRNGPLFSGKFMKRVTSQPGHCLRNHVIRTVQSSSAVRCMTKCLETAGCWSMNVFQMAGVCQLNSANHTDQTAQGDFQVTPDCLHYHFLYNDD